MWHAPFASMLHNPDVRHRARQPRQALRSDVLGCRFRAFFGRVAGCFFTYADSTEHRSYNDSSNLNAVQEDFFVIWLVPEFGRCAGMGPRGEHSRRELQELVLAAARRVADAQGLQGLTARNIAGEIGYAVGTLYNVFADLDDIIVQLNGRTLDELYDVLAALALRRDPEADLLELARAYIGFIRAHHSRWQVLFEYTQPVGRDLPQWYYEKLHRLLAIVEQTLEPLFAADERKQQEHAARVLWSATQGISSLAASGKLVKAESVSGLLRALITYQVRGLRASEDHPDFEAA